MKILGVTVSQRCGDFPDPAPRQMLDAEGNLRHTQPTYEHPLGNEPFTAPQDTSDLKSIGTERVIVNYMFKIVAVFYDRTKKRKMATVLRTALSSKRDRNSNDKRTHSATSAQEFDITFEEAYRKIKLGHLDRTPYGTHMASKVKKANRQLHFIRSRSHLGAIHRNPADSMLLYTQTTLTMLTFGAALWHCPSPNKAPPPESALLTRHHKSALTHLTRSFNPPGTSYGALYATSSASSQCRLNSTLRY